MIPPPASFPAFHSKAGIFLSESLVSPKFILSHCSSSPLIKNNKTADRRRTNITDLNNNILFLFDRLLNA